MLFVYNSKTAYGKTRTNMLKKDDDNDLIAFSPLHLCICDRRIMNFFCDVTGIAPVLGNGRVRFRTAEPEVCSVALTCS